MSTTPIDLYRAGKLDQAVEASLALVKSKPADTGLRFQLAELACVAGDLERADRQLETVSNQDTQAAVGAALLRQLVRAELARRECFYQGRVPEFIGDPSPLLESRLRALASIRASQLDEAATLIHDPNHAPGPVNHVVNGEPVTELRDLDDLLAPLLEVHTTTGKYFWVDWNQIVSLDVQPPKRPFDLLWRQASLSIEAGPDGEVYLPAIYLDPAEDAAPDDSFKLGRSTDWVQLGDSIVRGRGQRMLLVGTEDLPLMQLESIIRKDA